MRGAWLLVLPLAAGCMVTSIQPDGPLVDFTERRKEVGAVFDGVRAGAAHDGGGDARCAIEGAEFVVETEVGGPSGCTDHHDSTANTCESATEASFALEGSIALGDDAPSEFSGRIGIWSEEEGLMLFKNDLTPPEGDNPVQGLDLLVEGTMLEDAVFTGLSWSWQLSADEDEAAIWEVCTLSFAE